MAYYKKVKNGWRAQIELLGVRKSKTEPTKAEVVAWATAEEAAIRAGARGQFPARTVAEAFLKYEETVSSKKKGGDQERMRHTNFLANFKDLAAKQFHQVTATDIAAWRDKRLTQVSVGTLLREVNHFRNIWTVGRKEWRWCGANPFSDVSWPKAPKPRTQRWKWQEIKLMCRRLGYVTGVPPRSVQGEVAYAFLVAQSTSLRAGEIRGMTRKNVDLTKRVYSIETHKTDAVIGARQVPLTRRAARLLAVLDAAALAAERDEYFTLTAASLDALFRKIRGQLMLDGRRFHDSRADNLTRMARKVDVMTLARISGHKNIKLLFDTYYRETASEIAARIG